LADKADGTQLTEILTDGRASLEEQIRERLQGRVAALRMGIEILPQGVCLQEIHPPLAVVEAFRDVSSAFKEMARLKNEGEAFSRDRVIKAAGDAAYRELSAGAVAMDDGLWQRLRPELAGEAVAELNVARAFAAGKEQAAAGGAESFALVEAAHAAAPRLTEWRLWAEAWGESLPGKTKLILDASSGGRRHLLLGVPPALSEQLLPLLKPNPPDPP
jgi:regulator of protease activity HflC (stomatin/prohibitin superfamily)